MKQSVTLTLFVTNCILVYAEQDSGPKGPITFYDIKKCDSEKDMIDSKIELHIDKNKGNSLDFSCTIPEEFGPEMQMTVNADKLVDGEWQKDAFNMVDKPVLEFMDQNFKKLWKNFREALSPKIKQADGIPEGTYKVTNYKETWKNIEMEAVLYGRWSGTLIITRNDEEVTCLLFELQSDPPPY